MSLTVKSLFAPRTIAAPDPAAERRAAARKQMQSRYKVDLSTQQAQCEFNYYLLQKVLINLDNQDSWLFDLGDPQQPSLKISVIDRAPYTTTLHLSQITKQSSEKKDSQSLNTVNMTVCMYHDATMAEVVSWNSHRRIRQRYDYPNNNMYQKNEKMQHNLFLTEWLSLCQRNGRSPLDVKSLLKG